MVLEEDREGECEVRMEELCRVWEGRVGWFAGDLESALLSHTTKSSFPCSNNCALKTHIITSSIKVIIMIVVIMVVIINDHHGGLGWTGRFPGKPSDVCAYVTRWKFVLVMVAGSERNITPPNRHAHPSPRSESQKTTTTPSIIISKHYDEIMIINYYLVRWAGVVSGVVAKGKLRGVCAYSTRPKFRTSFWPKPTRRPRPYAFYAVFLTDVFVRFFPPEKSTLIPESVPGWLLPTRANILNIKRLKKKNK